MQKNDDVARPVVPGTNSGDQPGHGLPGVDWVEDEAFLRSSEAHRLLHRRRRQSVPLANHAVLQYQIRRGQRGIDAEQFRTVTHQSGNSRPQISRSTADAIANHRRVAAFKGKAERQPGLGSTTRAGQHDMRKFDLLDSGLL